jgi:DNA-binding winged helix-turn-helix (wHTH) protein
MAARRVSRPADVALWSRGKAGQSENVHAGASSDRALSYPPKQIAEMSTVVQFTSSKGGIAGYRFGQVELRTSSERLWVGGKETPLSPMAYRFLLGLCRASGALLTRAQAFDLLWPGGGNGSDEALAQVVAKVRQALGPDASALITLRSRGFRLDLSVEPISFSELEEITDQPVFQPPPLVPVPESSAPVTVSQPAPAAERRRSALKRRVVAGIVFAAAAAVLVTVVALRPPAPQSAMLDGYALTPQQFGPISAQGAQTLRDILARDDAGDRVSAQHLLETLLESEPRSAAAPFFLLYLIGNDPKHEDSRHWSRAFEERLPAAAPPYVKLLSRWAGIGTDGPGVELELLNAALKLEPSAWRLHLARGHVNLRLSHFDMALADFRAVPLAQLSPRYAMFVMSDRAALGDADAMQAELPALTRRAPLIADYVHARIEAARGNWKTAQTAYETTAEHAEQDGLFGSFTYAWLLAAVAAGEQDNWTSVAQDAERALRIGAEHELHRSLADGETMLGYARYRQARGAESAAAWDRAWVELRKNDETERLWLLRARIDPAWGAANPAPQTDPASSMPGVGELISARKAWLSCDAASAAQSLAAAEAAGVDRGYFADEADLLRQDLAMPRRALPTRPAIPYPMLERWISYWESTRNAGSRSCAK